MRKRLRKDWQQTVYKFWIEPKTEVPDCVFKTATAMRRAWNDLVTLYDWTEDHASLVPKCERKAFAQRLDKERVAIAESHKLNWECRAFVFDHFMTALGNFNRGRGGRPKRHRRLTKICIPHRYTGGGIPISKFFNQQKARRCKLQPVDFSAYADNSRKMRRYRMTSGTFGVNGSAIDFRCILHRPIPETAIVKRACLIGERVFNTDRRWDWYLALTVETPPGPVREPTGRCCGIDLGWRKFDDYVRVAMLVDTLGQHVELRLPLTFERTKDRRHAKYFGKQMPRSFEDLRAVQSVIDQLLEGVKDKLRESLPDSLPTEIKRVAGQLTQMRQGGIVRLLGLLREHGVAFSSQAQIRTWLERNNQLQRRLQAARARLVRRRRWIYQNFAAWVARQYDTIVWEGDLSIKEMAEEADDPIIKASGKYRQFAAIGDLRLCLKNAAAKYSATIFDAEAAYTSQTCYLCGGCVMPSPDVTLTCKNGHHFDRDVNAAHNLLSKIDPELLPGSDLRQGGGETVAQMVAIPEHIRSVAVNVHLD